ncbi:MAG TPA: hypothetical protein VIH57_18085 [Bacteroidales bacterium]|jgi:hypothetical protein
MKALQKNKQNVQHNGTQKASRNNKSSNTSKSEQADLLNNMVFSEYDVWPILGELYKRRN